MRKGSDKIVGRFPHPTVMAIVREPSYKILAEVHFQLNTNAASMHFHFGNGRLGLLYLTVTPAMYNMKSAMTFVLPENLGSEPTELEGSTGLKIVYIKQTYRHKSMLFKEFDDKSKAIKTLLVSAINETSHYEIYMLDM